MEYTSSIIIEADRRSSAHNDDAREKSPPSNLEPEANDRDFPSLNQMLMQGQRALQKD